MIDILAFQLEQVSELLNDSECETFTLTKSGKDANTRLAEHLDDDSGITVTAWNPDRIYMDSFYFEVPRSWLQTVYDATITYKQWEFKLVVDDSTLKHPFPCQHKFSLDPVEAVNQLN